MDDDLRARFDAISPPEMRRRVDLAIGWLRELRRGLAVHVGMTLEQVPGAIPALTHEQGRRAFEDIAEMFPLLRKPLTSDERARLGPSTRSQRATLDDLVEHLEDAGVREELAHDGQLETVQAMLAEAREGIAKSEMLGELLHEMKAYMTELETYEKQLEDRDGSLRKTQTGGGLPS